ncbi:uncharacterized protein E0L32_003188 [Thyridium curvatum]|uniref:Tse2 ADP-ribosyltransferase toxin domain-containing protein n=1 Tax=Thyridium curvatum TaxID=1093900 RepID=A0A507B358_9PEZI|nr:uncharacterized protein E0L32_003188 [Thyridium curvatum]TPX17545.1 hypothetical protein E0L32_003188 [Thyridium curvatum]
MDPPPGLIATFRKFPKELFRINYGPDIQLREWNGRWGRRNFDINAPQGWVLPKALDAATYKGPNGAAMQSNSPLQHWLVKRARADLMVYAIPEGERLYLHGLVIATGPDSGLGRHDSSQGLGSGSRGARSLLAPASTKDVATRSGLQTHKLYESERDALHQSSMAVSIPESHGTEWIGRRKKSTFRGVM